MRVLIVAERYPPQKGGLAASSHRIASGVKARGHDTHVLLPDRNVESGDMASSEEDGLHIHRMGAFDYGERSSMALAKAVEILHAKIGFKVIFGIYLVNAGYIAAVEAKFLGLKSLVMVRGNDLDRELFRPQGAPFVMGALKLADAVACVSREHVAKVKALIARNAVYYTPNSVDASAFTPGAPDLELKKSMKLTGPVIGFSGEMRQKKGMSHFLQAALEISKQFPGFKCLMMGGVRNDARKDYDKLLSEEPELKELVVETPYLTQPAELSRHYRLMDALFMPSLWEGMPNAALEAFACGVPVIGSTAGGLADLIEQAITGYSFPPGDFPAALDALEEFLSLTPDRRRAMGALAREKVMRDHTPEMEIDTLMEILGGIL